MKNISWDDLRVFFHVAEAGGLSGAARELGLSAATAGRRVIALEQAMGQALFHRSRTGYALTRDGAALARKVRAMQAAARPVEAMLSPGASRPVLRLTAGTATTAFLADRFRELTRPDDPFRLNFVTTEAVLDVAHREVELAIRNRPAQAGNLASRKLGVLRFAPYCSRSAARPELLEWVSMDAAHARHPAARWLLDRDLPVAVWANSVATVQELVRAGAGIGVMPCMIGDRDPALDRAGEVIEELTETQYLVMHDDDRHQPNLRCMIDRIAALYADHAALLAGAHPLRK